MNVRWNFFLSCLLALCVSHYFYSQNFYPEIENYAIDTYKADNQNWDIDTDNNGVVYVANNKGLLRFTGQRWQLLELSNQTIVRSVLCHNNKIYTGAFEEFGYWEKDQKGDYHYTSLNHLFSENHQFNNEEFWQIIPFEDFLILKTFTNGVFLYDGSTIKHISNSQNIYDITSFQKNIFASNSEQGLLKLTANDSLNFQETDLKPISKSLVKIASYKKQLFYYSHKEGGVIYNLSSSIKLPKEANNLLKKSVLNKVLFLNNNTLVFGTIKNGIYIYNIEKQSIKNINKNSGLCNNTVLGMNYSNGYLWLALDNGIGKINLKKTFQYYRDISGTLGAVYDVSFFDDRYFLASNTGLYTFTQDDQLKFINGTEGQVWNLLVTNDELIAGHNGGTFVLSKNKKNATFIRSPGVFKTIAYPFSQNAYFQATYFGIYLLKKNNGKWESKPIGNIHFPVDNILIENKTTIWATHQHKGLYKIILNEKRSVIDSIFTFDFSNSPLEKHKTRLYKINNQVLFYNANKWYAFSKNKLELLKTSQNQVNSLPLSSYRGQNWCVNREKDNELILLNKKYEVISTINTSEIKKRLVANYEKITYKNDSIALLNLNDGFVSFNEPKLIYEKTIRKPKIDKVYTRNLKYSPKDKSIDISYDEARSITFEIFTPHEDNNKLEYVLKGKVSQQSRVKNGRLQLQNLPHGKYQINFLTVGQGKQTASTSFRFRIDPPWYLSNLMKLSYLILFIILFLILNRINKLKLRRENIRFKKQYTEDTRKKINLLEKENLQKEIANKKHELSTSTNSIIKKNELIIRLSSELKKLLDYSPNKIRTNRILDSTQNHIQKDADWKIFESRFNELNQNFLKNLSIKHSNLTPKDLKICAYIKIGLTSKEIAPLMGITARSVELHRYRLRKKLEIGSNISISKFLQELLNE